jgi:3-oxoacyl-[acyl-carrier-protein] synthase II
MSRHAPHDAAPVVVAAAVADLGAPAALADDPDFRKASVPMALAYDAARSAVARLPETVRATLSDWGLVIGVDHGELEVTKDFLCTLHAKGVARPFLFQSSLHNATLGFLSMRLGLQGPGLTTTTMFFGGEDALALGADLLAGGDCDACLCLGVEAIDRDMKPVVSALLAPAATPGDGAAAVVLATRAFATRHGLGGPTLKRVACDRRVGAARASEASLADYYGANAVAHVAAAWAGARQTTLVLPKPDGSQSRVELGAWP